MVMPNFGKLIVIEEGQSPHEYPIKETLVTIGRDPANGIVISHPQVSRRHARLKLANGKWLLENLSVSNPVTIRGNQLEGPTNLTSGEEFELGLLTLRLVETLPGPEFKNPDLTIKVPSPLDSNDWPENPNLREKEVSPAPSFPEIRETGEKDDRTTLIKDLDPVLKVTYQEQVKEVVLTAPKITIGRALENDIEIPISTVSRLHAVLTRGPQGYIIANQNSINGLIYKGSKVEEHLLKDGDIIRIGDEMGNLATLAYSDPANPVNLESRIFQIGKENKVITMGRAGDNTLVLNYPAVSAHHAVIRRDATGGEATLEDLESTNGTFVKGQRVSPGTPVKIRPGETLQIGSYRLVYHPEQISHTENEKVRLDAFNIAKTVNKNTLVLLHDISLSIEPGEFVALVGGSGTGKSTLMDALNGFRPAPLGRVLLNGDDYYRNFAAYRSSLGYVPQDDIIHRELTVDRALYYVAKLRLPRDTSDQEIEQRVSEVLDEVEMADRRKVEVSRLSGGQRKRVSIAVELLAKPNLFFLDEPTSGLDPSLDKRMMFLLRRLADQGRTIILVTHATSNIKACDKVVFLAPGGRLCFFGPPKEALDFFEVEEFSDIYSKLEQSVGRGEEWEIKFKQSSYYLKYIASQLAAIPPAAHGNESPLNQPLPGSSSNGQNPPGFSISSPTASSPKTSGFRQFQILTRRYAELLSRDRINLLVLILQAPIIGFILALVAGEGIFNQDRPPGDAQKVLFMLAVAAVWLGTSNSAREITKENPIYLRERLVNLRIFPYIMSKMAVLTVLCILQSLLLTGIVMLRTGLPSSGALLPGPLELILGVWLTTMGGLAIGLCISAFASNTDKAVSIVPIILVPQIILAGLIFPLSGPSQVLSFVTISKWSIDSLGTSTDLDRQYYQLTMGAPPGIKPSSLPGLADFNPANYDDNPGAKKDLSQAAQSRQMHLLGRWAILLLLIGLFMGGTCYIQKRKDNAWLRR